MRHVSFTFMCTAVDGWRRIDPFVYRELYLYVLVTGFSQFFFSAGETSELFLTYLLHGAEPLLKS